MKAITNGIEPLWEWEKEGYRVVLGAQTWKEGLRTVRELVLEMSDADGQWSCVSSHRFVRWFSSSYPTQQQALELLKVSARSFKYPPLFF